MRVTVVTTKNVRLASIAERVRGSLFFVPMLFVLGGVALGLLTIRLDAEIGVRQTDLPLGLTSTVASARAVVRTVAAATITVAGIAFSIALLVIQQAAGRYSPRAVHGIFRDSFNKRVMGFVVGTFTFCLVVMRSIRSPVGGGEPTIPNISVALAVVFGIASILAILAFINHSAHRLEVSTLLRVATEEAVSEVRESWGVAASTSPERERRDGEEPGAPWQPPSAALVVCFERWGWVQRFDADELRALAPIAGTVRLEVSTGEFAIPGAPLCTIWPRPDDCDDATTRARRAVNLGSERTVNQDARYALRQLVDIALRGLSPGVNDPATAQEAIHHVSVVVIEMLQRQPPIPERIDDHGRQLIVPVPTPDDVLTLAFDEVRSAAAPHAAVCLTLIEVLADVSDALEHAGVHECTPLLRNRAEQVVQVCEKESTLPADATLVKGAFDDRFPPTRPAGETRRARRTA